MNKNDELPVPPANDILTIICTPSENRTEEDTRRYNEFVKANGLDKEPFDPLVLEALQRADSKTEEIWESRVKPYIDFNKPQL